jgi:fatty acid desaturase/predicted heme/steroid binding protein
MTRNKLVTASELAELNSRSTAAIAYRGKVYDVSGFLDKHPGGADQLLMAAGRDVTHFFDSYHGAEIRKLIASKCKYIGDFEGSPSNPKFLEQDVFYSTLEQRVQNFFTSSKQDPKVHVPFFIASAIVVIATLVLWYAAVASVCGGYSILVSLLLALLCGFTSALVTFNSHDIYHFAWTHSPRVWKVVGGMYCSVHGLSSYIWCYQHVIGHHVNPNHDQLDPDVSTKKVDFWRIKPFQEWAPHYSLQYIYMPLLFTLLSIKMKIQDFHSMIILKKADIIINPPSGTQVFIFFTTKALHIFYRVILPSFYIPLPPLLLLNLLLELVMGFWLGFITQLNHVNADVVYPDPKSSKFDMAWSEMQILTTADYATGSRLWNFLSGGLNSQVIHHLFPWILSVYYKDLAPILVQTCKEFGLKYNSYRTLWEMWSSHSKYLKDMGRREKAHDL